MARDSGRKIGAFRRSSLWNAAFRRQSLDFDGAKVYRGFDGRVNIEAVFDARTRISTVRNGNIPGQNGAQFDATGRVGGAGQRFRRVGAGTTPELRIGAAYQRR